MRRPLGPVYNESGSEGTSFPVILSGRLTRSVLERRWASLRRLFSTYPRGWPGIGLLLLRLALGGSLLVRGVGSLEGGEPSRWITALLLVLVASGSLLVIGFLTPVAAIVAIVAMFGRGGTDLLLILLATAVALVGPGAVSVDSRRFGRREIKLPR